VGKRGRLQAFNDPSALTRDALAFATHPSVADIEELEIGTQVELSDEASAAILAAPFAAKLTRLAFFEVRLSATQLAQLLALPALVDVYMRGGSSIDYPSLKYTFPTLDETHLAVFLTNPNARRLRRLSLVEQDWGVHEQRLRAALPGLEVLELSE